MQQNTFKTYQRGRRQCSIDTLFNNGMLFTNGTVDEGFMKTLVNFDIKKEGDTLTPRAGLRLSEIILPDYALENDFDNKQYHTDKEITLMAAKDCVENGKLYKQFILGKPPTDEDVGRMWVCTGRASGESVTSLPEDEVSFDIDVSLGKAMYRGNPCSFLTTPLTSIHKMPMAPESRVASIVGAFAFGNSFYFMNPEQGIQHTEMQEGSHKYTVAQVTPKELDPSEAVSFGYNMLAGEKAYSFINESLEGTMQLTGILPYSAKSPDTLLMTPHYNEDLLLRCYFKGQVDTEYKFVWEWRNVGEDNWNVIQSLEQSPTYKIKSLGEGVKVGLEVDGATFEHLEATFKAPTSDILVRVQAYRTSDLENVEKAMTVGFDFSNESYGATSNLQQEVYDLKTATGMTAWKNRLVLWGIPKDPTILFLSDVNDPSYFPYPNNISVFDEPIVYVTEFLDTLLVFTSRSIYQVALNSGGTAWTATLVQSDLSIEPWDRHLIQVVRNMVFFKSGDYYYMLVPKAQSGTGKLTLAPVSNSMTEYFNYFEKNVTDTLMDTFDYDGEFSLINYFNYLDYEDVHNVYVLYFNDERINKSGYLHFDILYNTVSRAWRIHTFESPHYLFPYKQDATKRGVLAATSTLSLVTEDNEDIVQDGRCIQLFSYDPLVLQDMYVPEGTALPHTLVLEEGTISFDVEHLQGVLHDIFLEVTECYLFNNWQFLDTGYRNDVLERNKRYRELQFQLNNTEGASLEFGLEFQIDGQLRMSYYDYRVEHVIDELDPDYGLIYVQATPIMNLPVEGNEIPDESYLGPGRSCWTLDQSVFPEVSLWKVRTPVSGKGAAPRVRLISRNPYRFELMNINWIYRLMNMR